MTRRRRHSSLDTRREIIDAAERLFLTVGYTKTTVADIAASLNMSSANVFKHFGSKIGLVDAMIAEKMAFMLEELEKSQNAPTAVGRLRSIANAMLRKHLCLLKDGNPFVIDMIKATAFEEFKSHNAFYLKLNDMLVRIVEYGIETGEFARKDPIVTGGSLQDALSSIFDPIHIIRHLRFASPEDVAIRCENLLDFVIASLRMPVVK